MNADLREPIDDLDLIQLVLAGWSAPEIAIAQGLGVSEVRQRVTTLLRRLARRSGQALWPLPRPANDTGGRVRAPRAPRRPDTRSARPDGPLDP